MRRAMNEEILADILRDMRNPENDYITNNDLRDLADRIEAAKKREYVEREFAHKKVEEALSDEIAIRDEKIKQAATGNAAAMREALLRVKEARGRDLEYVTLADIDAEIDAALAAPPRNCDRYGADGAAVACREALGIDWSHIILVRRVIGWLFSTEARDGR